MDNITSKVGDAISDTTITTKIKAKLAADSIASAYNISIETNQGVVTLSGKAPNQEAVDRTINIVKDTDDVREVKNNLTIQD
ncbi:periplasmic protein [endosymbiont of Acanthamoeba sp. UWC8]|uniref:BON domain-containing protein n=1 Tax=endosymbiont of Acanthamoeba sp. UWC8 TaxID=86106 RepID=UPI0004D12BDC|nr:BON domain-containing protein [endosymbiont of Acanthamoeba sp. UWC8]AIF80698.1 periplasmic protein [endosymbiont of Acanthamoeba sp. UWC8]